MFVFGGGHQVVSTAMERRVGLAAAHQLKHGPSDPWLKNHPANYLVSQHFTAKKGCQVVSRNVSLTG